jgi:hypothetical protein
MKRELEKVLEQRQKDNECIICGKGINEKDPTIFLAHFILGRVEIHERHIKRSGSDD